MFSQLEAAKHRAKLTHAVASRAEQQRQLDALRGVIASLLGLGSESGGGAIPGLLGGLGAALGDGRQN